MDEDEKIVRLRRAEMKKKYNSVETGMYVENNLYFFESCRLFNGQIVCMLPSGFDDMDIEQMKNKYPSESRPQIIKMLDGGGVDLTFNLFDQPINPEQMKGTIEAFQIMIKKVQPANQFISDGKVVLKADTICHWSDFKSYAVDNSVYNFLFIINMGQKFLLGMFNAPYNNYVHWKPVMLEIMKTIHEEDINES